MSGVRGTMESVKIKVGDLIKENVKMTLKEKIINDLSANNITADKYKIKYYEQSPYQKNRYKSEFVEEECWLYFGDSPAGICIVEDEWKGEYKKDIIGQLKER